MSRIGIMSMQRIHNYGSSLQAYALKRLIESTVADAEVTFVDYRPGPVLVPGRERGGRVGRTIDKVVEYGQVRTAWRHKVRFFDHKRGYGRRYFPALGIPATPDYDTDLDVQVIGSDEVFNCVQSNTNVGYTGDLFGRGSQARRIVTYAGSFGNTTLAKIEATGIGPELAADFRRMAAVSVRDRNSAQIVKALTGQDPFVHVDPVLAYDYLAAESDRIPEARQSAHPYLIVYGYSGRLNSEENQRLAAYARARGLRILCFGGVQECCDEFVECDPFRLLAYFRDAEAVITDTFHGTIFSIINHRPFGTIVRPSSGAGYGNEEKLSYLLEILGLSHHRVSQLTDVHRVVSVQDDWAAVDAVVARERVAARSYLRSAVGSEVPA